jgi:hypothetical protein
MVRAVKRITVVVAGFLAISLAALTLRAEVGGASTRLSWTAPAGCPDEAALAAAVEGFLGQTLDEVRAQKIFGQGRVTVDAELGFTAHLRFSGSGGGRTRKLSHSECASLAEASALVIALAIDPERVKAQEARKQVERERAALVESPAAPPPLLESGAGSPRPSASVANPALQPESATQSAAPAVAPTSAPLSSPPRSERVSRSRVRHGGRGRSGGLDLVPSGALLVGAGMLPAPGTGLGAGFAIESGAFRVAAVGRSWFERSEPVTPGEPPAVGIKLVTVGARFCGVIRSGELALAGCAGADIGDMTGRGENLLGNRTQHDRFSGLFAGLELGYRGVGRVYPVVGVEGGALLERPRFGYRQNGRSFTVFRPSPLGVQGSLGLSVSL